MNPKNYWKMREAIGTFIGYLMLFVIIVYFIVNLIKAFV